MFFRGFKSWCENVAVQVRKELALQPVDLLNPTLLAECLGVGIWTPKQIPGLDEKSLRILLKEDADSWSAVTLSVRSKDLIIVNSSHSKARQASDLTHELSHILIGHEPGRVDISEDGLLILNTYNRTQEDEANWLAGCLLLPRELLVLIRRQQVDLKVAAKKYGVSSDMMRFRLNVTGVDRQFQYLQKSPIS